MNFIIVGCGRVGAELANRMFKGGHQLVVVDNNRDAFNRLHPDFRGRTLEGEGLAENVLERAGIREADGLALSSRNVHLSPAERAAAPVLRRALLAARSCWERGERSAGALREAMRTTLAGEPRADVEYVSVADATTLEELERVDGPALLSLAVRFGSTRLIDNEPLP